MTKIGFIFECGPQGADKQVCEYLARKLLPEAAVVSQTLDNKPRLLKEAADVASALFRDGCDRVLIVWDLRPAWPDKNHKPCRHDERKTLLETLTKAGIVDRPVFLVCVEQELESWLLADERKLAEYLSTPAHAYSIDRIRKPDKVQQPKATVNTHFKTARGWRYEDRVHALKVVSNGEPDWSRLRKSESFARFEKKLTTI